MPCIRSISCEVACMLPSVRETLALSSPPLCCHVAEFTRESFVQATDIAVDPSDPSNVWWVCPRATPCRVCQSLPLCLTC